MGLGKTLMALKWLEENSNIRPAIVVCPASLKWVWQYEALHHLNMRSKVLEGTTPSKIQITKKCQLIILNYEILQYWFDHIIALNPQALLVDECHYIKNLRAKRTKIVRQLGKIIPHVVAISGTPLTNRPSELWPTLNLIRPDIFKSLWSYRWRYCKPVRRPWGWEYKGAENLSELHRNLRRLMMIRRLKKDVLPELPEKTRHVIPLKIDNYDEYEEAQNNFILWLNKQSAAKANRAKKAEKLVQLGYLKRLAAELKIELVLEWIENFLIENEGKLVIYCIHKKIIRAIYGAYKKHAVVVDGSIIGKKRLQAIRKFHTHKNCRLFIGNIQAAGVGFSLSKTSTMAFVEIDWTPGAMIQAEDRIDGLGRGIKTKSSTYYYLVAKDTIEENLCELIQKKQAILSATLDGKKRKDDLNIYNELMKTLLKG